MSNSPPNLAITPVSLDFSSLWLLQPRRSQGRVEELAWLELSEFQKRTAKASTAEIEQRLRWGGDLKNTGRDFAAGSYYAAAREDLYLRRSR